MANLTKTKRRKTKRTSPATSSKFGTNSIISGVKSISFLLLGMLGANLLGNQINNMVSKSTDSTDGLGSAAQNYIVPGVMLLGGIYLSTTQSMLKNIGLGISLWGGAKISQALIGSAFNFNLLSGIEGNNAALPEYMPGNVLAELNGGLISDGKPSETYY